MSPPPLSHFPDLCLLAIFKHIPLSDLIRHIGLVCPNWAQVQRDELKRRRSTKHLVIVQDYDQRKLIEQRENPYRSDLIELVRADDGLPWVQLPQQDEFNALRVSGDVLTKRFTTPLIALLPNITHLTIFQKAISQNNSVVESLEQIVLLLNQYSTKLVSLKLHFTSRISNQILHYFHESIVRKLFNSINRLTSLRHLSFDVKFPYYQAQSRLRILSRLSTFTVHSFELSSLLFESLREYAITGDVRVDCDWALDGLKLKEIAQLHPQLASRFTRTSFSFHNNESTRLLCTRFNSLTTLNLKVFTSITLVSQALSQLPLLISLSLNFDHIPKDTHEISQVPSVRLLILTISTQSHLDTERLHLHQIFPNLQVFHLIHHRHKCYECEFGNESERASRVAHCMCLARQPFRQCANLHTVKLDINRIFPLIPEKLFTVDELHALDSQILAEKKAGYRNPTPLPYTIFSILGNNFK